MIPGYMYLPIMECARSPHEGRACEKGAFVAGRERNLQTLLREKQHASVLARRA